MFSPELKVKRFLDSLAYFILIGHTQGIETDYKKVMHAKREIPASNCPAFVENLLYATGGTTDTRDQDERATFKAMTESLDEKAEKYETKKPRGKRPDSKFQKYLKSGIRGGEWCRVDTDGVFQYRGEWYRIDEGETQYQPVETELGLLYDMDRILATTPQSPEFYDMNYDRVKVSRFDSHD